MFINANQGTSQKEYRECKRKQRSNEHSSGHAILIYHSKDYHHNKEPEVRHVFLPREIPGIIPFSTRPYISIKKDLWALKKLVPFWQNYFCLRIEIILNVLVIHNFDGNIRWNVSGNWDIPINQCRDRNSIHLLNLSVLQSVCFCPRSILRICFEGNEAY